MQGRESSEEAVVELSMPQTITGSALQTLMGVQKRECWEVYSKEVASEPSLGDLGTAKRRGITRVCWNDGQ